MSAPDGELSDVERKFIAYAREMTEAGTAPDSTDFSEQLNLERDECTRTIQRLMDLGYLEGQRSFGNTLTVTGLTAKARLSIA